MNILFIGLFGVLGVYSRYFIEMLFNEHNKDFPVATLCANLAGCLIAGIIYAFMKEKSSTPLLEPLLFGFCGGLTTFSAFSLQSFNFLTLHQNAKAIAYLVLSPTLGLLCVFLGFQATLYFFFSKS